MKINPDQSPDLSIMLKPVSQENWVACAKLELLPEQANLLAPNTNIYSIAESKFEPHYQPRAICMADQVIGFLMYCPDVDLPDPGLYWLFRFMLGAEYQGKGYGALAIRLALAEMKLAGARRVITMHKPSNQIASRLYQRMGFCEVGYADDGDVELELVC
ncbi:GNAT family N-acetyltransferase [Iodobacter fluviatilis]|uniref:Diamine N-acetyltransferase n=1 Tax=Iodobacter fluviatilis TaxID=537 RepID=A0A377Q4P6_9NEIS|nr:GNAT family N-acetyltransferase [Iodobacter fluviatilis]TCU90542.1 diamine N-acetyltransferase [Iodobacter fluviatilis]STQ89569.1 Spermine/spermidine acetyltransferase [Iodobacter fluviatilis]